MQWQNKTTIHKKKERLKKNMTEENVSNNENVAEIKKVNKPKRNFRRNYVKKDKEEV